ncbi:pilus assembly PilX family protein [Cerasicoccus frondis]|uniref:pilus assembly PilX family protein n=1 Tax=Cerasicoccus frondis TaxID=490090 RepID=UPI00285288F1|nr:hypothetical protein [Cerasicoccus frondis]
MLPPKQKMPARSGFALIVSLVLMGFIVMLLLSLTTMVSVEVNSASQSLMLSQARQNALLGLNVAIGELQRATGPDQRVTALAGLEYAGATSSPNWVGVYAHGMTPDYDMAPEDIAGEWTDDALVNDQGSAAKLLTWLISGNTTSSHWPTFTTEGVLEDPEFARQNLFEPNAVITFQDGVAAGTQGDVAITDVNGAQHPARILVGSGAVGDLSPLLNGVPEDYVVAPLVEIDDVNENGMTNGYAWWVGDENVKARANLTRESNLTDAANAFVNPSRAAIELMAQDDNEQDLGSDRMIGNWYDPDSGLSRASGLGDLVMLSPQPANYAAAQRRRFHDVSVASASLLTDSFAGGLKRDLSALLAQGYTIPASDATANDNLLWTRHGSDSTGYAVPTWGHLRSFAQTRVNAANEIDMRLPIFNDATQSDDVGAAPVLTYFSLGLGFTIDGAAAGSDINLNLYPMVVLWNPYNVTLKAPALDSRGANMEVGMMMGGSVEARIGVDVDAPGTHDGTDYTWKNVANVDLRRGIDQSGSALSKDDGQYIRFGLKVPDIPPGQSLIFSLPYAQRGDSYASYPVLENIEPEPDSFVSVPIGQLDENYAADTRFRAGARYSFNYLGEPSVSLSSALLEDGKGGLHLYLGKPRTDRLAAIPMDDAAGFNPSNTDIEWYQSHQSIDWKNAVVQTMTNEPVLVSVTAGEYVVHMAEKEGGSVLDEVSAIQAPAPIASSPRIAYVIMTHALFSGAGNNAQYNENQYMFPTRWIAQGNMRAPRNGRTRRDMDYLPLFIATAGSEGDSSAWQKFANDEGDDSNRTSAGSGHDWSSEGPVDATLFEILGSDDELQSIGQLQHANLSLVGAYPSYPIGNSLADFRLHERSTTGSILDPEDFELARADSVNSIKLLKEDMEAYYDISYLLNRNLWDAYYFSTIPRTGQVPDKLPNARMTHTGDSTRLRDADTAAAELSLEGGFNVNSTSEQAWRAVLGAGYGLKYNPETGAFDNTLQYKAAYPRFTHPTADDSWDDPWQGYRSLSEQEIAQLAHNIVIEIQNRGPFISVGDFVNRRLVDNPDTDDSEVTDAPYEHETLRGVIQAAIDRTWSTADADSLGDVIQAFPTNDAEVDFWAEDDLQEHKGNYKTSSQFGSGSKYAYDLQRLQGGDEERKPYSNRSAFSPKYITQADVLSAIGAGLTARSDTFTIRAYGEVESTFSGDRIGAWCEAVVQRMPDYLDEADAPEDAPTATLNQAFGRRYKIISFRWLQNDEV